MLFSIIIPVYNVEKYLKKCIQSVLCQTYSEWEIIAVDDGSTDESLKIMQEYANQDKRIQVYTQENQGSAICRNRGLNLAKGEYICFLDADDFWIERDCLEQIAEALLRQKINVLGTFFCSVVDDDERIYPKPLHRNIVTEKIGRWVEFAEEQNPFYYWSYVFSRTFLLENDITFPNYRRYQDPPFLAKALSVAKRYYVIPVEWYCYRVNSVEKKFNEDAQIDMYKGILEVAKIAKENSYEKMLQHEYEFFQNQLQFYDAILSGNYELIALASELSEVCGTALSVGIHFSVLKNAIEKYKEMYNEEVLNRLKSANRIIVYGTGAYGTKIFQKLVKLELDNRVCFAVTKRENESEKFCKKIFEIEKLNLDSDKDIVIVATNYEKHAEMMKNLDKKNFSNVMVMDSEFCYFFI